jgi:hypothetical protein
MSLELIKKYQKFKEKISYQAVERRNLWISSASTASSVENLLISLDSRFDYVIYRISTHNPSRAVAAYYGEKILE